MCGKLASREPQFNSCNSRTPGLCSIAGPAHQHEIIDPVCRRLDRRRLRMELDGRSPNSVPRIYILQMAHLQPSRGQCVLKVLWPSHSSPSPASQDFCWVTKSVRGDRPAVGRGDPERFQRDSLFTNIASRTWCVIVSVFFAQLLRCDETVGEDVINDRLGPLGSNRLELFKEFRRQLLRWSRLLLSGHLAILTTRRVGAIDPSESFREPRPAPEKDRIPQT